MNVLVVDDTPDCREPLARFLKVAGYLPATASNGREALEYLSQHRADVILLDLMMPTMDGLTFLRALRKDPNLKDLPVIVVTAMSDPLLLSKASELGVRRSLLKSRFSADELLSSLREACPPSQTGREAPCC